jgi:hypothetical protein
MPTMNTSLRVLSRFIAIFLLSCVVCSGESFQTSADSAGHIVVELRVVPGMDFSHPAYHLTLSDDGVVNFEYWQREKKREFHSRIKPEQTRQLIAYIEKNGFFQFQGFGEGDATDASYSTLYVHSSSNERLIRVFDFEKNVPHTFDDIHREILRVTNTKSLAGRHAIPKRPKGN